MATYTIKPGDSLSKIGAQYGVPYQQITGYRSGNPNIVYPGEVVTIPDKVSTPAPVPQPQAQARPQPQPQPNYATPQMQPQSNPQVSGSIDPNNVESIKANYPGYAGWNDPAAIVADFRATGGAGKGGGTTANAGYNPAQPAIPNFQNIYDTAIAEGTKDYQTQFDTLTQQIQQKELAKNAAIAKIADNPYLSEATMSGRIDKINRKFNADVQALTGQQANVQNRITTAKADAQVKLNIATSQYNIQNQQYQQNLQLYSNMLSSGAFINASPQDIANASISTGIPTSMIQSIVNKQKKDQEIKPTLQTVDDGTNQYVVALDQNGKVINKSIIAASKPKAATGTSKADKQEKAFDEAIADGIKQLRDGEDWGTVWNRIKAKFPDVPDILIDTGLGTSWRQTGAYQAFQAKTKPPQEEKSIKLGGS